MKHLIALLAVCASAGCVSADAERAPAGRTEESTNMRLGNFCLSLVVKDLDASRAFYEKLGFTVVGGDVKQHWLVLRNESTKIGLFQGLFDRNMLTFNPGWDHLRATPADFDDVRDIQRELKKRGLTPTVAADEASTGPAYFMLADPDGNPILVDQHVPRPE